MDITQNAAFNQALDAVVQAYLAWGFSPCDGSDEEAIALCKAGEARVSLSELLDELIDDISMDEHYYEAFEKIRALGYSPFRGYDYTRINEEAAAIAKTNMIDFLNTRLRYNSR